MEYRNPTDIKHKEEKRTPRRMMDGQNGYRVYAEVAKSRGVEPGGLWEKLRDWPHAQLRAVAHPGAVMNVGEIDATMKERFGC
jgi:hypothetical protein